jgi:cytoskeletal protein RodZ
VDYVNFGRYLTQQRELRGMSREEVATATKIPANLLAALENGQVERLPERVFIINYIRAYAQVIGLASDEAVLRFEEIDENPGTVSPEPAAPPRQKAVTGARAAILIALVALAVLALLALTNIVRPPWHR